MFQIHVCLIKFVKWKAAGHPTGSCVRELWSCEILTDSEPKISQIFQKSLFLLLIFFFFLLSSALCTIVPE